MRCSEFLYPASIARCQHIKVNGTQCGSPALKKRKFCYFHQQWQQGRIQITANRARRSRYSLDLPILEDANAIQVALMQAMRLLLTQQVDHKTAALLFYGLQTASTNLRNTNFEPPPQRVVIDRSGVSDTSLGDNAWYEAEFADQENEEEEPEEAEAHHKTPETVNLQAVASSRRDSRPRELALSEVEGSSRAKLGTGCGMRPKFRGSQNVGMARRPAAAVISPLPSR